MEFAVNRLSGSTVKLDKGIWTALSIKQAVAEQWSWQSGQLRLLHAGEELLDHGCVLADHRGEPVQLDCVRQAQELQNTVYPNAQNIVLLSRELWLQHVECTCIGDACLRFAPMEIRDDSEVVMTAAVRRPGAFEYASQRLRSDLAFVSELLPQAPEAADHVETTLHSDPGVLKVLENLWLPRIFGPSTERWGGKLLPTALRMSRSFVMEAIKGPVHPACIVSIAAYHFHSDYDVVAALVKKDGLYLQHADGWLCDELDIVTAAVSQAGRALEFASNRLRADRAVVMVAVDKDWRALEFADNEMLNDCKVIKSSMCPSLLAASTGRRANRRDKALYHRLCRRSLEAAFKKFESRCILH